MDAIRRLETFARLGYLARGVVYGLLGYFALTTAGGSEGTGGVFAAVRDAPLGAPLLLLLALGLAGYGVFRLYGAAVDLEAGDGAKHTAQRVGHAASGFGHLFLAFTAAQLALGSGGGGGDGAAGAARTVLDLPLGDWLLLLIGIGFLAAALEQATKAWTAKFMARLDADAPSAAEWVGRAGYAARAVVFLVIGWSVLQAGMGGGADEVKELGGALTELSDTGFLYTLVAVGLLMFGVFSLVMARYRRIRDEDVLARLKRRFAR